MMIEDGTGSGKKAAVDGRNRIKVLAITESNQEVVASDDGTSWTGLIDAVAPAGAAFFAYLSNTGVDTLEVTGIRLVSSANVTVRVSRVTGTPVSGTNVTPVNVNFGVTTLPTCVYQTGANITGLTEAATVDIFALVANTPPGGGVVTLPSHVYVTPGTALALKVSGAATLSGTLQFYTEAE